MKKLAISGLISLVAVFGSVAPAAHAQSYYPAAPVCVSLTSYLAVGSSGTQVTQLQQFLNQQGYLFGVSGYFDNGTYGAVVNFQTSHGIAATGTVGPQTRSAIQQVSCGASVGSYVAPAYVAPYVAPVQSSASSQSCYSTGSTYVCNYATAPSYVAPATYYPSGYTNGYTSGYGSNYNNGYNNSNSCSYSTWNGVYGYYCGNQNVTVKSFSSSYSPTGVTITVQGTGFSSSNTVHFGSQTYTNVYSNGSSLVFTVPYTFSGYAANGSYGVTVTNASGITSNTLSFTMNSGAYGYNNDCTNVYNNNGYNYNNGCNNGYNSGTVSISNIAGASTVQSGTTNTWSVSASGSNGAYVTVHADWGDNYGSNNSDTQQSYSNAQQTFSFSHTYTTPGTYTIRMTATTNNGSTQYSSFTVHVNGYGYYY